MGQEQLLKDAAEHIDSAKGILLDCREIYGDQTGRVADIVKEIATPETRLLGLIVSMENR